MSVLDEVEELKAKHASTTAEECNNQTPTEEEANPADNKLQVETTPDVPVVKAQEGLNKMISKTIEEGKDIKGMARDLTFLAGASNLQSNDDFKQEYQTVLGAQLLQDLKDEGKREAIKAAARKQEAKNIRAQAYYDGCKPIFELLGIEKAFGLVPMVITTVLLMLPFLIVSLIRFAINSVNSIFTAIAGFKKPAFWLCTIVVTLVITALVVLAAMWGIDSIFGTHIILR